MSTILIERLGELVSTGEMSRAGLARAAGLHPNSLRKLGEEDWNPTADTLLKLERFLAAGSRGVMATSSFPPRWRPRTRSTSWPSTAAG